MYCASHPRSDATRECAQCSRLHCDACVKRVKAGQGEIEICAGCGGLLRQTVFTVGARGDNLQELLLRVFSLDGLLTAVAIAIPGWMRGIGGLLGSMLGLIYCAGLASYYFLIVDHVGRGRDGMPGASDAVSTWGGTAAMALRGISCAAVGLLPLLLALVIPHQPLSVEAAPFAVVALLALGQLYMPAAILAVVLTNHTLAAFWPVAWGKIIAQAPAAYARLVGVYLLALMVWLAVGLLAQMTVGRLFFVGGLFAATVSNLFLFAQAALLGGFLRRHAEDYGY